MKYRLLFLLVLTLSYALVGCSSSEGPDIDPIEDPDVDPPEISSISPASGSIVDSDFQVSVTVSDENSVSVSVFPVDNPDASATAWEEPYILSMSLAHKVIGEEETYLILAEDLDGNISRDTIIVTKEWIQDRSKVLERKRTNTNGEAQFSIKKWKENKPVESKLYNHSGNRRLIPTNSSILLKNKSTNSESKWLPESFLKVSTIFSMGQASL